MTKCVKSAIKAKGRLKKGYRWAKGRKACPIKAKTAPKRRRKARR